MHLQVSKLEHKKYSLILAFITTGGKKEEKMKYKYVDYNVKQKWEFKKWI